MKNEIVTQKQQEQGMQWLDVAYGQAIKGIGLGDTSVEKMAGDYLAKYSSAEEACKAMLKNQVKKCTSSGVITGFGGFTTLPFTLPLNVTSVLYMQMRMIACTAYLAEYSPSSDQTETLVLACLVGEPLTQVAKQPGDWLPVYYQIWHKGNCKSWKGRATDWCRCGRCIRLFWNSHHS